MTIQRSITLASFTVIFAAMGCVGTGGNVVNGRAVTGVDVGPSNVTMSKGTTRQFEAVLKFADGTSANVTDNVATVWNTSDATIASVSTDGVVTAVAPGFVDVSADFKGEKGNRHFGVTP